MSPEAWMLVIGIAALAASSVVFVMTRRMIAKGNVAIKECGATIDKVGERIKSIAAERDAALKAKSEQFETWQAEATNLRRDVAALEERLGAAQRELALLRPIAAAAHALATGKNEPGEWAGLREALKPWAEREGKS